MINQELLNFIKSAISQGQSREQITKSLSDVGWQIPDIEDNFNLAMSESGFQSSQLKNDPEKLVKKFPTFIFITILIIVILGGGASAYYFYYLPKQKVSEGVKVNEQKESINEGDTKKEEILNDNIMAPQEEVEIKKEDIVKEDATFSEIDKNLILATIKKHDDIISFGSIYIVSREMKDDKGNIMEDIKYSIQLTSAIDKITIIEGKPNDSVAMVLMSARYHNAINQIKKRLEANEISKNKFAEYEIEPKDSLFKVVFSIDTINNLINDYGLYMNDNLVVIKSNFQIFDNFSKIIIESSINDGSSLKETYIKQ